MQLRVSPDDGLPLYLQIMNQIKYLIASRRLCPGDEVPPIRVLAEQLYINPNTVARAYRELETAGLLTTRRGAGTYVSDRGSPLARRERLRLLGEQVDLLLVTARQLGFGLNDTVKVISDRAKSLGVPEEGGVNDD